MWIGGEDMRPRKKLCPSLAGFGAVPPEIFLQSVVAEMQF